jgi:hypothetical protein
MKYIKTPTNVATKRVPTINVMWGNSILYFDLKIYFQMENRMNASDITKSRQNRVLFQAYYRPIVFPLSATSTINYSPISSVSTNGAFVSSFASSINIQYGYKYTATAPSYELLNDINEGKYIAGYPCCSTISDWNTGLTTPTGTCDCKISFMTWKNTRPTLINNYQSTNYSTVLIASTIILTGPSPYIC